MAGLLDADQAIRKEALDLAKFVRNFSVGLSTGGLARHGYRRWSGTTQPQIFSWQDILALMIFYNAIAALIISILAQCPPSRTFPSAKALKMAAYITFAILIVLLSATPFFLTT